MIVITGATGHIGNVLVRELLKNGEYIRAFVYSHEDASSLDGLMVEKFIGDVTDFSSLIEAFKGADVVYHLAGIVSISSGQKKLLNSVNAEGTKNVVKACIKAGVRRLVYTSSVHAIVEAPNGTAIDETSPFDPDRVTGDYAKSKALASLAVLEGVKNGLDAVIVCPSGVIGPYDYKISELGHIMLDYINKRLKAYINGAYDFVDVRDVVNGMILACKKGRTGESYILSGERITIKDILNILEKLTGIKKPSFKVPLWLVRLAAFFTPIYYKLTHTKPRFTSYSIKVLKSNCLISSDKSKRELGYSPRPIYKSIEDSIKWFKRMGYVKSPLKLRVCRICKIRKNLEKA